MKLNDMSVRRVLLAEMERANVSRHALQGKTKMPMSTIYQVFNTKRDVRLALEAVSLVVAALGRDWAWLERQCGKTAAPKPAKPVKDAKAPAKAKSKPKKKR